MPFPIPMALGIVCVVVVGWAVSGIMARISWSVGNAHTGMALKQMEGRIGELDVVPEDEEELLAVLREAEIDWNSCELRRDGVFDAWGNEVEMKFDGEEREWRFLSWGADGERGTEDDL